MRLAAVPIRSIQTAGRHWETQMFLCVVTGILNRVTFLQIVLLSVLVMYLPFARCKFCKINVEKVSKRIRGLSLSVLVMYLLFARCNFCKINVEKVSKRIRKGFKRRTAL